MSVVAILCIPVTAGLPHLMVRNMAQYFEAKKFGLMKGLIVRAGQFALLLSLVFASLTLLAYFNFSAIGIKSSQGTTFILAMCLVPIWALDGIRSGVLGGLRMIIWAQLPEVIFRPVLFFQTIFLTIVCFSIKLTPELAMLFQASSSGIAFILGLVLWLWKRPREIVEASSVYETGEWIRSSLPFCFLGVMAVVSQQTDIVMLNFMKETAEVGIYKVVVNCSLIVVFLLTAVNSALAPQIARLWCINQKERMQKMITICSRIVVVFVILVSGFLIIWGEFILRFFFGDAFAVGVTALRILCVGQIVNGFAGSVGNILNMTGHEKKSMHGVMIAAIINVLLNSILIPVWSVNGAAIATAVSLATWNILMVFWLKKHTGLDSTVFKKIE
jgi:O-antigen/teichoic acid export membrane protein